MERTILTIKSQEVPEIPHLEAIISEVLLKAVKSQLLAGKYDFIAQQPGNLGSIEGYKTPLENSEIVLHICIRENNDKGLGTGYMSEYLHWYIESNMLKITQAVRHVHGKHCRIVISIYDPDKIKSFIRCRNDINTIYSVNDKTYTNRVGSFFILCIALN